MGTVTFREFEAQISELAARVEAGETVVVTRDGKPVFELVPPQHRAGGRLDEIRQRIAAYKEEHGIERIVQWDPDTFDDPLTEEDVFGRRWNQP